MRIAVAGGTGLVGTMVVDALRAAGAAPVALARSTGVDLVTGAGLDGALEETDAVIDVSNLPTAGRRKAVAFFGAVTANLLAAERRAGVGHHVALTVVGCDRVPFGYYLGKRCQEELLAGAAAGGRATVLRATQFHEFAAQMLDRRGPIVVAPVMLCQPVSAREVAGRLVALARADPPGGSPEMAGPEVLRMPDLVRRLATARRSRRPVVTVRLPGAAGRQMAIGGLLPTDDGPRGEQTFAEWLAGQTQGIVLAR